MSLLQLTVLLVVYVALDFSNPLMPGAVVFGAGDSVEGRQPGRVRDVAAAGPLLPAAAPRHVAPIRPPVVLVARPAPAHAPVRHARPPRSHPSSSRSVAPSEDH
jgi:hypothetical protein